jgi:hypothetical protein
MRNGTPPTSATTAEAEIIPDMGGTSVEKVTEDYDDSA